MDGIEQLLKDLNALVDRDKTLRIAALSTHAVNKNRIFGEGGDADGGKIGSYSTEPTYISNRNSPVKVRPVGKNGDTTFSDGTPHKSAYFHGGYKEYRSTIGRQTSTVDLRLSGQMESSYVVKAQGNIYVSGFLNPLDDLKADGNEERFEKEIFALSEKEADIFLSVYLEQIDKQLT